MLLQRIPEAVRQRLREQSQAMYRKAACCEIRFVSDWKPAVVTLVSYEGNSVISIFYGDYFVSQRLIMEEATDFLLELPSPYFLPREELNTVQHSFAPQVWRLVLHGGEVHLLNIKGETLRPPDRKELPPYTYLAYGPSITQGAAAASADLTYVKQAAWRLRSDAINLGVSGSAYCEEELADYIADRGDWDVASLCISVNMLNQGVPVESFQQKAAHMVEKMAAKNPDKPIICIGLLPVFMDIGLIWPERNPASTSEAFRTALQEVVHSIDSPNVHYVDGRQLLRSGLYGLSHDLLHPGNHGMIEMGEHLAAYIKPLLERNQV
ncbi:SGNH/GDSL hydrolase family protein [Paenibacillus aurantius]|uniref:SGNH/GDSL hydrolase family protein n=1 Tax=Paenibacillus aurantius TaxID=2918900 RepID=A0AA96LH43_9BACL|nr:GDSL-type esterase/lipase family protein [Paenibacillus aurantius]WNQ14004.1 SGNH/GDSL hydrolase family protein [Paenibacillus aurantius]